MLAANGGDEKVSEKIEFGNLPHTESLDSRQRRVSGMVNTRGLMGGQTDPK